MSSLFAPRIYERGADIYDSRQDGNEASIQKLQHVKITYYVNQAGTRNIDPEKVLRLFEIFK